MPPPVLTSAGPSKAGSADAAFDCTGTYAGVFAGSGRANNRIIDAEGFANWGNPGWAVDYGDAGFIGGALVGKKFEVGNLPLRIEIDGTFGGLPATSNRLDPDGLNETVKSEFRWIATASAGIEQAAGPATVFASGGLAVARIVNSVTDIDFGPDMPSRIDLDDSFRDSSTEIGWVIGLGCYSAPNFDPPDSNDVNRLGADRRRVRTPNNTIREPCRRFVPNAPSSARRPFASIVGDGKCLLNSIFVQTDYSRF